MSPTELIAENHITISQDLFNEGMLAAQSASYKKALQRMVVVIAVLFVAVAGYLWYTGLPLIFLLGECIFVGAILFWLAVMLPRTRRRSKYKIMSQNKTIVPKRTILFYPDHLTAVTNNGKEISVAYCDVVNYLETEHLWIINCIDNRGILLHKEGFTQGNFEDVKALLESTPEIEELPEELS
jgi:hypothetical protein